MFLPLQAIQSWVIRAWSGTKTVAVASINQLIPLAEAQTPWIVVFQQMVNTPQVTSSTAMCQTTCLRMEMTPTITSMPIQNLTETWWAQLSESMLLSKPTCTRDTSRTPNSQFTTTARSITCQATTSTAQVQQLASMQTPIPTPKQNFSSNKLKTQC